MLSPALSSNNSQRYGEIMMSQYDVIILFEIFISCSLFLQIPVILSDSNNGSGAIRINVLRLNVPESLRRKIHGTW